METSNYVFNILKFWRYKYGKGRSNLSKVLSEYFGVSGRNIFLLENGRSAEYLFLKSLRLMKDSGVAVQCFTCNAAVNPILWLNLRPVYIDVDPKTLNMSLDSLYDRIDGETRVVIVQHTFGTPLFSRKEEFEKFVKDMHERNIFVFEDCAHALGGHLEGKPLGTFGDAALLSFGIEKVLPTRVGGALIVNNHKCLKDVKELFVHTRTMGDFATFIWLLNPLIWRVLRRFSGGFKVAAMLRKMRLLNMGFYDKELIGEMPRSYPKKLSNVLSEIVLQEMRNLDANLSHRREISSVYEQYLSIYSQLEIVEQFGGVQIPFLKYPIFCETERMRNLLREFLKSKGVNTGDWYDPIIYPKGTSFAHMEYGVGVCSKAESLGPRVLNLPTDRGVSIEYAEEICNYINLFLENYEDN